jgi:predicted AlkP superfamily phosphohydrolase/phosphomutase
MLKNKVLLIGVDQSIPYLLNKFIDQDVLPNIKNLMDTGTYTEGLSCVPCDTPTNWTTIATGATTAIHGATGFYTHIPGEELDYGATQRSRSQLARFVNAEYIWDTADRSNLRSFIFNYPAGWLAQLNHGIMSGFTWPIPEIFPVMIKAPKHVIFSSDSVSGKYLIDDDTFNFKLISGKKINFKIETDNTLNYTYNGQTHSIRKGQWSVWFSSTRIFRKTKIPIFIRFMVKDISVDESKVEILTTPLFNAYGWSSSPEFSSNLLRNINYPQKNPTSSDVGYTFKGEMEDVIEFARRETKAISDSIYYAKKQLNWGLCYFHIHHLDTINHNALARLHPEFPLYNEKIADETMTHVQNAYRIVDNMVGNLMKRVVDKNTTVIYISDHGALPCWRIVNIVKPLVEAGLMVYKKQNGQNIIDWSKSKVFPYFEPTFIWVNLKGRDPQGIVHPNDYESVRDHVIDVLSNLIDPDTNRNIMDLVIRKEDHPELQLNGDRMGDVVYFFNSPYNIYDVSNDNNITDMNAASTISLDLPLVYNSSYFYGAHVYYLPTKKFGSFSNSVPIIFNGPEIKQGVKLNGYTELIDIAPTIANILRIPKPAQSQGKVLQLH